MKVCTLLTMNLSLEMTCLRLVWRVSYHWSIQNWTIILCIILGIQIVWTNTGEVRLVRMQIRWGKNRFLPGETLILLISSKNPKYLWLWDSTQRGIFLHGLFQKRWDWLLRYYIVFRTIGVWRGQRSPSRFSMTLFFIGSTGISAITCWRISEIGIG